jgi:hypothetical protein
VQLLSQHSAEFVHVLPFDLQLGAAAPHAPLVHLPVQHSPAT